MMGFETFPISSRKSPENRASDRFRPENFDFGASVKDYIQIVENVGNFLGEGGAAAVFALDDRNCMKVVLNRSNNPPGIKYNLGNTAAQEKRFMDIACRIDVGGVRCPEPSRIYSGTRYEAIIMERIHGYDLQRVLRGEAGMPSSFDIENSFRSLHDYIDALYEIGVIHNDIAPRNIMVTEDAGTPVVIDFGRARAVRKDSRSAYLQDIDNLTDLYEQVSQYLTKNRI